MDRLRSLFDRLLGTLRRGRERAELDEEMRFHLRMATEENIRAGMSPREARRRARIQFGGQDWVAERAREERGGVFLEDFLRDLKFGLRGLRKRPVFALTAILTLSVGVGMTTTMFTLVDAVVLRPLPGSNTRGLVYLSLEDPERDVGTSPTPELLRLVRDHASSFSRVEAYSIEDFSVSVEGEPHRITGATASTGFFSFLGIQPQLGRVFLTNDGLGSGAPVVVLSHTLWAERFGESREVLGRTMVVGGLTHEIVGVLPRDFRVDAFQEALFWVPEGAAGELFTDGVPVEGALAALAPGVTPEAAEAELNAIVQNNPLTRRVDMNWVAKVSTPVELTDPSLRKALLLLQGGAILVFLIACGNLANLLLAQGEARARELAVRSSLGAGRGRLVRQLLAESAVLGALGGAGGVLLTTWALEGLPLFLPRGYAGFALNREVLLFATGAALMAILVAGLLPALTGSKWSLLEVIKGRVGSRVGVLRRVGVRQILVTAEVAMAFVLLASAGLLFKSLSGLMRQDVGFTTENLLTVRVELPEGEYEEETGRLAFYQGLRNGLRERLPPRLGSATVANGLVENLSAFMGPLVPEDAQGTDQEPHPILAWKVAPDYFQVLGLPLSQGRAFLEEEGSGNERAVIVNDEVSRRYFPDGNALGRRLRVGGEWHRVVGVAASVRLPALAHGSFGEAQIFLPMPDRVGNGFTVIARTTGDRAAVVERIKEAVWALDRSLPVIDVSLVEDALAESLGEDRSNTLLMVLFALTALTLGAVGIFGVVAYSVGRRIREMGIRLALGASARGVVTRVIGRGMVAVGIGLALGAGGAFAVGSTLAGLLVDVEPRDPVVFLIVTGITASVALAATWLPARRAAAASPIDALRAE